MYESKFEMYYTVFVMQRLWKQTETYSLVSLYTAE